MCSSNPVRLVVCFLALAGFAAAQQELEISASPTPVGSGARAAGMADAFVAIADDATAASWNPAGLVQLERPELSIVGAWNAVYESFGADWHPEVDSSHLSDNLDLNYLSFVYPLPVLILGRNATVSLNYQRKYDFTRDFTLDYHTASGRSGGAVFTRFLELEFEQEGGLSTLSPAFAIEITNRLSIGATVNFWRSSLLGDNRWEQKTRQSSFSNFGIINALAASESRERYDDFRGENVTLGLLWAPNDQWSLGVRYDSAFTGTADYRGEFMSWQLTFPGAFRPVISTKRERREVRFPDSLAVGVARRFNDRFTLALDVTRTDWNDFTMKDGSGRRFSLVDASPLDNRLTRPDLDPTITVRLGGEYVFVPSPPPVTLKALWSLRGGLFIDQEPATGKPQGFYWPWEARGDGKPDTFYGVALGAGVQLHRRANIDVAYQLRYGPGVNADFIRGLPGFEEDVVQHRALLSLVWYF